MNKGKRPYIPKVKGCYECSQRRIHCDRQKPSCVKCTSKGLKCSGLGVRYRFSNDLPLRLNLVQNQKAQSSPSNSTNNNSELWLYSYEPLQKRHEHIDTRMRIEKDDNSVHTEAETDCVSPTIDQALGSNQEYQYGDNHELVLSFDCHKRGFNAVFAAEDLKLPFFVPDNIMDSWKRHLLSHFAMSIAPELVVLDDQKNGWRHLVLPVACLDDLVMDAVLSAAAAHFMANHIGSTLYKPEVIYARAIQKLQERQNLAAQDKASNQAVILALLVLLSTVMVNGYTDFPTIFRLLETATEAMGGEEAFEQGELGNFVVRQIRKYRGYAAPQLSREQGVTRLSLTTTFGQNSANGWDDFKLAYQSHPEFSQSLSTIYELHRQSCDIYVARGLAGKDGVALTDMVGKYISTLNDIPEGTPGEHTLVFATFIAAAEASLPKHQLYLTQVLMRHYERNGFANILCALDCLKKIWSDTTSQDWTQILPTLNVFIV